MLKIQVIPRSDANVYQILREKIDNEARTFIWADKKKLRLRHVQPAHAGQIRMRDADGILVADTHEGDQIAGAFIGRLTAWFPEEIVAINIQVLAGGTTKKRKPRQ
jgi:hypothetical protein